MTPEADEAPSGLVIEERLPLVIIRFNRPAERNSLNTAILSQLEVTLRSLASRSDIQALIFTGTDDVFASGADIRELSALTPATARGFALRGQRLFQQITDLPQLTVAAINGYCMGGGLDLALACRLRCASQQAVFAHPGGRLGIITGWGGTQRLPRLIGAARALELFATARRISAIEALQIGLVTRLGDPVPELACELAQSNQTFALSRAQTLDEF